MKIGVDMNVDQLFIGVPTVDVPPKMVDTISELDAMRQNILLLNKKRNNISSALYTDFDEEYRGKIKKLEKKLLRHKKDFERIRDDQESVLKLLTKATAMTQEMIEDFKVNISLGQYSGQQYGSRLKQLESQLLKYKSGILDAKSVISAVNRILDPGDSSSASSNQIRKHEK